MERSVDISVRSAFARSTHQTGSLARVAKRLSFASLVSVVLMTAFTMEQLGAAKPASVQVKAGVERRGATVLQLQVVELANQARIAHNLSLLIEDPLLDDAAQQWADQMVELGRLEHAADLGEGMGDTWIKLGENVGRGGSVAAITDAWLKSEKHRANIIDPTFDSMGVGVVERDGTLWIVQRFRQTAPNVANGLALPTDADAPNQLALTPAPKVHHARDVVAGALVNAR
jgi:uncharacterized protein YkwD